MRVQSESFEKAYERLPGGTMWDHKVLVLVQQNDRAVFSAKSQTHVGLGTAPGSCLVTDFDMSVLVW